MAPPKGTTLAVAGCAAAGLLSQGFVAAPGGRSAASASRGAPVALRGAGAGAAAASGSGAAVWLGGAAAVSALAAAGAGKRRGHARAAAASTEAEVFDPKKEPGVTLPLMYFDPLGFAKEGDREGFRNLRAAELKHGRVAMMAALGAVAQHTIKFPGFETVPAGIGAVTTPPGTYGFVVLFLAAGAVELTVWKQDPEKEPGDFGDPAGLGQYYEEWRNRELNNGRMAMFSIMGIIGAELATGLDAVEQIFRPVSNLPVE